ncbi:hypothetical protein EH196_15500 [Bacillus sp. C1-1]|nr:hypothetical protein EH196_15500 [Bacillus sp. C1-1]
MKRILFSSLLAIPFSVILSSQAPSEAAVMIGEEEDFVNGHSIGTTVNVVVTQENNLDSEVRFSGRSVAASGDSDLQSITITPSQSVDATGVSTSISLPAGVSFSLVDSGVTFEWTPQTFTGEASAAYDIPQYTADLGGTAVISGAGFSDQAAFNFGSNTYALLTQGSTTHPF